MTAAAGGARVDAPGVPSAAAAAVLAVPVDEDPGVRAVFTSRRTGNQSLRVGAGDVVGARSVALAAAGTAPSHAVFMEQVHGGDVASVDAHHAGRGSFDAEAAVPGVDALVTTADDVALAVLVADCVPILLVHPHRAVGAVHAGREGLARGVVEHAVQRLAPGGADSVVAIIGPAIGGCCYEVPAQMVDTLASQWSVGAVTTTWGTPALDLPAVARAQLEAAGVARIETVGSCTRCHADTWFSHRAATAGAAPGRQAGIISRREHGRADATPAVADTAASLQSP